MSTTAHIAQLLGEIRLSVRSLRTRPGLVGLCTITLALGLGSNAVVFSMLSALIVRPFPFEQLDRLMLVRERRGGEATPLRQVTPGDFGDIERETEGFVAWAAYRFKEQSLAGDGFPETVRSLAVTANFFHLVGTQAGHGRIFETNEDERTVILSDGMWRHRLGARPDAVGSRVRLDGRTHIVVGIMPRDFVFPMGADVWVPLVFDQREREERDQSSLFLLGLLNEGSSAADGRTALAVVASRLASRYPDSHLGRTFHLLPLRSLQYQYTLPFLALLQFSALFVLLLATANTVSLVFAYRQSRERTIAVLGAMGATPSQLARLSVIEASFIAGAACLSSLPLAYYGVEFLRNSMPAEIARFAAGWNDMRLDGTAVAMASGLTLAVGVLFGLATRYRWRAETATELLRGGRRATSPARSIARGALVASEVALALVLMTGATLLELGFQNLEASFEVLEPDGVLAFGISLPPESYPSEGDIIRFGRELEGRLVGVRGLQQVGALTNLPASNVPNPSTPFVIEARPPSSEAEMPIASLQTIAGEAFQLLRIPLLDGRYLNEVDQPSQPNAAVVSSSLARLHWSGRKPIGDRIRLGGRNGELFTIVGVVADIKQNWFEPVPPPTIYVPLAQRPRARMRWTLRSARDPYAVAVEVREVMRDLDPQLALSEVQSLPDAIRESIAPLRIIGTMTAVFAALAALLAAAGVYAVVSAGVAERTHELGVRIALGASGSRVLGLVLRRTLVMSASGLAVGIPATLGLNHALAGQLFGLIEPKPGLVMALACLTLSVALFAGVLPARRAASLDPMRVLRRE